MYEKDFDDAYAEAFYSGAQTGASDTGGEQDEKEHRAWRPEASGVRV